MRGGRKGGRGREGGEGEGREVGEGKGRGWEFVGETGEVEGREGKLSGRREG